MKNKYSRFLSVLCALMIVTSASWAERVSQEDAALVAGNFMSAGDTTSQGAQAPGRNRPIRRVTLAEDAQYYVYANANGEGWVMVAANDVVTPILAYSETGEFRTDKMPDNVKYWLGSYDKKIKYAEQNNIEATEEVKAEWRALRKGVRKAKASVTVSPLIQTTWDQDAPYYNLCPKVGNERTLTGCVATAMAQVMNYWQWPVTGTGSYSYTSETQKLSCSANFGSTTYDWANMLNRYAQYYNEGDQYYTSTTSGTTAQQNAVATLMYHCGVAAKMDYDISANGGSGTQTIYPNAASTTTRCAAYALINNFGYKSSTLKCYYRPGGYGYSAVNDATWLNLLKTELNASRPIMYAGADNEGGHSFICDGYDSDNKFHFNWGWSGYCNGYYTVDNLVPGTGGSGAGNGSYNDDQDIIIGIIPDKTEVTITWSVNGVTSTTTQTTGTLVLPSNPSDCSGAGGKKFVGWTESNSVSGSKPSDLFTSGSGITVTSNKKYYAVYATASGSGGASKSYTFNITSADFNTTSYAANNNEKTATATASDESTMDVKWTSYQIMKNSSNMQFKKSEGYLYNSTDLGTITAVTITSSAGSFTTYYGDAAQPSTSTTVGGGYFKIVVGSTTGTVSNIAVTFSKSSGTTTYSDYSLTCGVPCSNTPTMSFSPATVNKTTADASFTKTVSITGKGSGQTVVYSSSDETIATVTNAGVVTLKGKVGSTTITASVAENGTYCAASASYTLNVAAVVCSLSSISLNTTSVQKTFVTGATLDYTGLVVTANYSNCSSQTVEPTTVTVSPSMATAGEKTVTVSYTENSVTRTATYLITVVAPYTVTYKACGDVFATQQYAPGAALVLPTETPVESTGKTFYGWIATEHYTGASAPEKISAGGAVNANATYYAVFH